MKTTLKTRKNKILSIFIAILDFIVLFSIYKYPKIINTLLLSLIFILILFFYNWRLKIKKQHFVLQISLLIAQILVLILVELKIILFFLLVFLPFLMFDVYYWSLLYSYHNLSFNLKPWRRLIVSIWTFNLYIYILSIHAFKILFNGWYLTNWFFLSLLVGGLSVLVSLMVWNLYFPNLKKLVYQNYFWLIAIFVIMFELFALNLLLPLAFFSAGFWQVWFWYIIQLLIRFKMTEKGIVWSKQIGFLVFNSILLGLFFILVKWF